MTSYHQTPYTLDEKVEIPEDAPLSAGHSQDDAADVKERSDEHRAQAKAEREAAAKAAAEQAEAQESKPKSSKKKED